MGEGEETTSSPKNRVKFLCSHGGKILPRPPDGQLKYVGGETRVVAVPRDINYPDLMKKLNSLSDAEGEVTLKYQVIPEDLDILVSVTCDEDLHNMLSEHDRYDRKSLESNGSPKLRAFLFPSNSTTNSSPTTAMEPHTPEQRYIDAINGICRPPIAPFNLRRSNSNSCRPTFSISSAGSSPTGYPHDGYTSDTVNQDGWLSNVNTQTKGMIPKVNSSPNLYNLAHQNPYSNCTHQQAYYVSPKLPSQCNSGMLSPALSMPIASSEYGRLTSALSMGSNDYGRFQVGYPLPPYCSQTRSHSGRGSGEYIGYGKPDGCRVYRSGGGGVEMVVGLPQSSMGQ